MLKSYEKFTEIISNKNISTYRVSKETGVSLPIFTSWKKGKSRPNIDNLKKIADFLNVPVETFTNENITSSDLNQFSNYMGEITGIKKIPVIGTIKCGTNGLAFEDIDGYAEIYIEVPGDIFALRCKGDSMKDEGIKDGSIAIIRKQDEIEDGEIAAVIVDGEEGTLKRVRIKPNMIILEAANSEYPARVFVGEQMAQVKIVGRLMSVIKNY